MIVLFSACHKDHFECKRLLEWCRELGTYPRHQALIVFGKQVEENDRLGIIAAAKQCEFKSVAAIAQKEEDARGWPFACNQMFQLGVRWVEDVGRAPFLWLESDATPLKPGWLDTLEEEYIRVGKPFMGVVYDWVNQTRRMPHLTGVAIYPANFRRLNPYPLAATKVPWDCTAPEQTLPRTHRSELFCHEWGDRASNVPPTFQDLASLSVIPSNAVLFHRCKDGSLIDRLRERNAIVPTSPAQYPSIPLTRKILGLLTFPFTRPKRKIIRVRRTGAYGDAIAATCIAEKLNRIGYDVIWQAKPEVLQVLEFCPALKGVEEVCDPCDVILDGAYEGHKERCQKAFWEIFVERANQQLNSKGIFLENPVQCTPRLELPRGLPNYWRNAFSELPRPWVAICPRSNSFRNRTVPNDTWRDAARAINASLIWLGTEPGPPEMFHLHPKTMVDVAGMLAACDLLVSVDSGPLHLGAALGVPAVALLQASSPELHITDQRDFIMLSPEGLSCLNCQSGLCPINQDYPPCQEFDPYAIAAAVNRKLQAITTENVSAVITAYRPPADRLNQCINAVLPQVSEVVVTFNADGIIPEGALRHPRVRYLKTRLPNIGYGRNANFGARHTSGRYVLFLNDDVFLDSKAVRFMTETMKADPKAGMVGCLLFYPDGRIQHGGTRRNPGDLGWGHIDHNQREPSIKEPVEMENITQAAALMRREAFYSSGCYDEQYFMYYEDNALCLQMRRAGWKVIYNPLAYGIHDEHQTLKSLPNSKMAENLKRSRAIFEKDWGAYFKHNPPGVLGNFNY